MRNLRNDHWMVCALVLAFSIESFAEEETTHTEPPSRNAESKKKVVRSKKKAAPVTASSAPVASSEKSNEKIVERVIEVRHEKVVEKDKPADKVKGSPNASDDAALILRVDPDCYVVEFEQTAGKMVSCTEPLALKYWRRECGTSRLLEKGQVNAIITCEDEKRIGMRFKSTESAVFANLRVHRQTDGKKGIKIRYHVESARRDQSSIVKLLPEPEILPLDAPKPEEAPLTLRFSGFAALEHEYSRAFGFANAAPQMNTNFLSNLQFEASKDRTGLVSILEIGEIYFGDVRSGGGVRGRAPGIIEIRDIYLNHGFSDSLAFQGGLAPMASDPRAFIFSDQLAGVQFNYKTDLADGAFWGGTATSSSPPRYGADEYYAGIRGTLGFLSSLKTTLFTAYRYKRGEMFSQEGVDVFGNTTFTPTTALSKNYWAGATFALESSNPFSFQLTGISNWVNAKADAGASDKYVAWLGDAKLGYFWSAPQIGFSLEGLGTSGSGGARSPDGLSLIGKRKSFNSPIGSTYLMTVATSDGLDDAVGSPKTSTIANLNTEEGLRILVASTSFNLSKRVTGILRYGYMESAKAPSASQGRKLGDEGDIELLYQMTPSTTLQADYGRFFAGNYYGSRFKADLAALRMKYTF